MKSMRRPFTYILILLLSLVTITLWWPVNDSNCNFAATFLTSQTNKFQVNATQVIVQPWHGEHHVYGIFMVPNEYKQVPFFVLSVKGVGNYCAKPYGYKQNLDGIYAEPGTHLIRSYVRTRTALLLILRGLYGQINDKQNWVLTYPEQKQG